MRRIIPVRRKLNLTFVSREPAQAPARGMTNSRKSLRNNTRETWRGVGDKQPGSPFSMNGYVNATDLDRKEALQWPG